MFLISTWLQKVCAPWPRYAAWVVSTRKILRKAVVTLHYLVTQTSINLYYPLTHLIFNIRRFTDLGWGSSATAALRRVAVAERRWCQHVRWHSGRRLAEGKLSSFVALSPASLPRATSTQPGHGFDFRPPHPPPCSPAVSVHIVLWYFRQLVLTAKHKSHGEHKQETCV